MIRESHEAWAARQVEGLPPRWRARLYRSWDEARADVRAKDQEGDAVRRAGNDLLRAIDSLSTAPLPLDASDMRVCEEAAKRAEECHKTYESIQHLSLGERRAQLAGFCVTVGVRAPDESVEDVPAIARMSDSLWWRRALRRAQAHAVEGSAIALGYVHKRGDCYVSDESVAHRAEQNARNAAMLEATIARNLDRPEVDPLTGEISYQEFTLAELAAKGTSDKTIRRCELMTRISGFERIAIDMRHQGAFFTVTCPTEMHAYRTASGHKTVRNRKYQSIRPNEAQSHLSGVWARIRAALARHGVKLYGFRVAEPNHDGTPHWHCLMFFDPLWVDGWHAPLVWHERAAAPRINAIVRRYALEIPGDDLPTLADVFEAEYERVKLTPIRYKKDRVALATARAAAAHHALAVAHRARRNAQKGAKKHRVDWKAMDASKGTAAAYIAKYIAKNIDGYRLEKDLYGNDSIEASQRVDAWASRWRIRQFQQVGGPPVTVWRELRRVKALPDDAPGFVVAAHHAVNKTAVIEGRTEASVAWHHYVHAQGGVFCGRKYRVRLATLPQEGLTRYFEARPARVVGIEYAHTKRSIRVVDGIEITRFVKSVVVESERFTWEILRTAQSVAPVTAGIREMASSRADTAARAGAWAASGRRVSGFKRENRAPWTCVNNCTDGAKNGAVGREAGIRSEIERGETAGGRTRNGDIEAFRARKVGGRQVSRAGQKSH